MPTPTLPPNVVAQVFDAVAAELLETCRVAVPGFGVFELYRRKGRKARNPRTGDRIDIPARTVVRFRPAAALKARVATREPR